MDQDLHQFWDQRSPEGVGVGLGVGSSVISTVKELKRSFKDVLQGLNSIRKLFISFTSCSIMTWFLRGLVWERVWKLMTFLVWNRVRIWRTGWHNVTHKQMQRVPPPPRETVMMPFLREEDRWLPYLFWPWQLCATYQGRVVFSHNVVFWTGGCG